MDERSSHMAIGIDAGGSFKDVVVHDPRTDALDAFKVPSTPADPVQAVVAAVGRSRAAGRRIGPVIHGATVATNTMREGTTARSVLVTTRGFHDLIEIRTAGGGYGPPAARRAGPSLHPPPACRRPNPLARKAIPRGPRAVPAPP